MGSLKTFLRIYQNLKSHWNTQNKQHQPYHTPAFKKIFIVLKLSRKAAKKNYIETHIDVKKCLKINHKFQSDADNDGVYKFYVFCLDSFKNIKRYNNNNKKMKEKLEDKLESFM